MWQDAARMGMGAGMPGNPMQGGQTPQSSQWLMSLLQALFGGSLGQGGGMGPMGGGMGAGPMGGPGGGPTQPPGGGLPKMPMPDTSKMGGPTAGPPSPYGHFNPSPRRTY